MPLQHLRMNKDDYTPEQWATIFGVPVDRIWRNTQPQPQPRPQDEAANEPANVQPLRPERKRETGS